MFLFSSLSADSDSISSSELQPPTKSEIFCNSQEQDKFLPDEGSESSALLELHPGKTINSCKRFFTAPASSGLFIRLVRNESSNESDSFRGQNTTEYCPISIVSSDDLAIDMIYLKSQSPARASKHQFTSNVSLESSQIESNGWPSAWR